MSKSSKPSLVSPWNWTIMVATSVAVASAFAADKKMSNTVFNRPILFKDNGNVRPLGRIFTNVPPAEMPTPGESGEGEGNGTFEIRDGAGILVSAVVDNHIFLTGSLLQNQNSFPGQVKIRRPAGTEIASFGMNGNLYVDNLVENATSCVAPVWEGEKWNSSTDILLNDNCYNYGNNQLTFTFAQPGRASGPENFTMTVDAVRTVALRDGLTWVGWNFPGNGYTCSGSRTLVFMTVDPGKDYHWYRLDKANGKWTHKPGSGLATDLDASNNLITNPLTANRNYPEYGINYSENGGFYCTCGSDANVR